jgi:hypothetical protein
VVQGGCCQLGPAQPDLRFALLSAFNDLFNSYSTSTCLPSNPLSLAHTLSQRARARLRCVLAPTASRTMISVPLHLPVRCYLGKVNRICYTLLQGYVGMQIGAKQPE